MLLLSLLLSPIPTPLLRVALKRRSSLQRPLIRGLSPIQSRSSGTRHYREQSRCLNNRGSFDSISRTRGGVRYW